MYEYDLCLSNLLHAWEGAAKVLREYEDDVPHELRLSGSVCLDCFEKDYTNTTLTDADADEISLRWRKLGILRDLYLDEAISRDFERYKVQFVSQGPELLKPKGIRPIMEESPELVIKSHADHKYTPDFKARFHQSLCLHSIALVTRLHAVYSRDQTQEKNDPPNRIGKLLCRTAVKLWDKLDIKLNGRLVKLRDHAQFDCIEIYDFLYYFLLEKVVPFSALESWTVEAEDRHLEPQFGDGLEGWRLLLDYCRWALQPSDIVDLVKHKTWRAGSNFPADKFGYLCERGHYDLGGEGAADFHSFFIRYSMICEAPHSLCSGGNLRNEHQPCLWDEPRIKLGSPFKPGFRQMLDLEAGKMELDDTP